MKENHIKGLFYDDNYCTDCSFDPNAMEFKSYIRPLEYLRCK